MSKGNPGGFSFVLLGVSGSGKGTLAQHLQKKLPKGRIIGTGEGLREIAKRPSKVGRYIKAILERGGLVPHWMPAFLWIKKLTEEFSGDESLIFDGACRRIEEARLMDEVMAAIGRSLPRAIYFKIPPREAEKRLLLRGRHDDNHSAIAGRFAFFRKNVQPVIRYYRKNGRLITINADQTRDEVWKEVRRALKLF